MYIQGIDNVYDLAWNSDGIKYGDVFLPCPSTKADVIIIIEIKTLFIVLRTLYVVDSTVNNKEKIRN